MGFVEICSREWSSDGTGLFIMSHMTSDVYYYGEPYVMVHYTTSPF